MISTTYCEWSKLSSFWFSNHRASPHDYEKCIYIYIRFSTHLTIPSQDFTSFVCGSPKEKVRRKHTKVIERFKVFLTISLPFSPLSCTWKRSQTTDDKRMIRNNNNLIFHYTLICLRLCELRKTGTGLQV